MNTAQDNEQWVSFRLGDEVYAHPVYSIKEVFLYEQPAPVPGSPEEVEGVLDVRGNMVTLLSGQQLLNLEQTPPQEGWCIIILDLPSGFFGISVEAIEDMIQVPTDNLDKNSNYQENPLIQGTVQLRDTLYILVDFSEYCETLA